MEYAVRKGRADAPQSVRAVGQVEPVVAQRLLVVEDDDVQSAVVSTLGARRDVAAVNVSASVISPPNCPRVLQMVPVTAVDNDREIIRIGRTPAVVFDGHRPPSSPRSNANSALIGREVFHIIVRSRF